MTNRRTFLVGSISVVFATSLPVKLLAQNYPPVLLPILKNPFEVDIMDVIETCHDKFLDAKHMGDWMYMFQEEIENKMKLWGTFQPLKESVWGNGPHQGKGCNVWYNPNFFDECHFMGSWDIEGYRFCTDGFTTSFKLPTEEMIKVRYYAHDKKFEITPESHKDA